MTGQELRITYRREGWSPSTWSKTRLFGRRHDAQRFIERLESDGRPDLSNVIIRVHQREVGRWREVDRAHLRRGAR